jgi:polysaccharide biosynthesis protein PslH
MKLLWISQNLPYPPTTGVLQRNYNLIREASGFAEIDLIAIAKDDILPDFDRKTAETELQKLCRQVVVTELPTETSRATFLWVLFKSLFTRLPFTVNWADSVSLRELISESARSRDYDLVYFDSIGLAPYRAYVGNAGLVMNHHNIESCLFKRRVAFERNPLKRMYLALEAGKLERYEATVADLFDVNITVSELDATLLRQICPAARTGVVANGVDVRYFSPQTEAFEPGHLVMVSGMNWFPNRNAAEFMVEDVWPMLATAMPDSRLTIVGADPPAAVLKCAAHDPRVQVTGFVRDVRGYIERAQIYLCPMLLGGGTRLKILDALAMKRPIVATTMALEGIPVEAERDVLVANSPREFVRQVARLVENPGLGKSLAASGREFVERHFSWEVISLEMNRIMSSVVTARRKHA